MPDKGALNLIKLCVGAESVADLAGWQVLRARELAQAIGDPRPRHRTRMQPKRGGELLTGGSLYWVIKGMVLCRQTLEDIQPVDCADGVARYDLVLSPEIVLTRPAPRRPFQGWRYLPTPDAPRDVAVFGDERENAAEALPPELERVLDAIGVV